MPLLRFTPSAEADVQNISVFIAEASFSPETAQRFADRLIDRCEYLASLPGTMGRDRSELRPGLRSMAFRNYVIFFRYIGDAFEVVNVLEGHRDIQAGIGGDGE